MIGLASLHGQALRRLVRHYLEMVMAMVAGMVVLGPAELLLLDPVDWAQLRARPEPRALIMATNMTLAMAAWMRLRRHRWAAIAEMAAAMYLALVALFPLLWLRVLSASGLMALGHLLMLVAMAAAMLRHRDQYTGTPGSDAC